MGKILIDIWAGSVYLCNIVVTGISYYKFFVASGLDDSEWKKGVSDYGQSNRKEVYLRKMRGNLYRYQRRQRQIGLLRKTDGD